MSTLSRSHVIKQSNVAEPVATWPSAGHTVCNHRLHCSGKATSLISNLCQEYWLTVEQVPLTGPCARDAKLL